MQFPACGKNVGSVNLKTNRFSTIQETKNAPYFMEIPHAWLALLIIN
jgi:hypothetical protein